MTYIIIFANRRREIIWYRYYILLKIPEIKKSVCEMNNETPLLLFKEIIQNILAFKNENIHYTENSVL